MNRVRRANSRMSGIYVHIPFCKQACSYCDFYFVTRQDMRSDFVKRLCEEIGQYRNSRFSEEIVKTIYIGGGTPSLLTTSELEKIFDRLYSVFDLDPVEVTMELNPDDVSVEYLRDIRSIGIGRASMGIQSFDPDRLRFMNRAHNPNDAIRALENLCKAGFDVYTVDLIYGHPGQSPGDLELDIDRLLEYDPPHVSAYSLTFEPRTRLGKMKELGRIQPADDKMVSAQFDLIGQKFSKKGLFRYEISNYSKPGFEAIHNTNYWHHHNYLGLGPSAHSFWWEKNSKSAKRWESPRELLSYLREPFTGMREEETLTLATLADERLMLGLRTRQGVDTINLQDRYSFRFNESQMEWLNKKISENLFRMKESQLSLTDKGLKIADYLIVELISRGE